MKILMLNHEFPPLGGGAANATHYIGKNLIEMGHEVHVFTSRFRGLNKQETVDGIKVHRIPVIRKEQEDSSALEMFVFILAGIPLLHRFLRKYNPDIIHAFFGIPSGLLAYFVTRKYHMPYIVSLRGSDVPYYDPYRFEKLYPIIKSIIKRVWKNANKVIANSEGLKKLALKTDSTAEIEVIPNGIDLSQFTPSTNKNADELEILTVGRAVKRKGFQYLIMALPEIISRAAVPFHVTIVGTGPYLQELIKLTEEIGVEEYVQFLGLVDHNEVHNVYQGADVFILPSLAEGMPNVILEAMASGLPIITTDTGGTKELVNDNGIIIPLRDSKAIADAILNLFDTLGLRKKMGIRSREIAESLSWKNVAQDYFKIYEEITNKGDVGMNQKGETN